MGIFEKLTKYKEEGYLSAHMPGHKSGRLLPEDLEKAMLLSFDNTIEYLIGKKEPIAMITVKSRNNLLRR